MRWISRHFGEKEVSAADRFIHRQRAAFAADPKWRAIFPGELCRAVALIPPYEGIPLEHLLCPVSNASKPSPGSYEGEVRTYSVLRFEVPRGESMDPGMAGVATLADHAWGILAKLGCLTFDVAGFGEICLARRNEPGQLNYLAQPTAQDRVLYSVTLEWVYEVSLDPETRRLQPLLDAGYYA